MLKKGALGNFLLKAKRFVPSGLKRQNHITA